MRFVDENNVQTCPIKGQYPGVGTGAPEGSVCSGRGQCIDGFCVCNALWDGRGDYYDLRGLDCHNPWVFEKILWSLNAIAWFRVWIYSILALRYEYLIWSYRSPDRKSFYYAIRHPSFILLVPMMVFVAPGMVATSIFKVFLGQLVSVDLEITIALTISGGTMFLISIPANIAVIGIVSLGNTTKNSQLAKHIEMLKITSLFSCALYSAIVWLNELILPFALRELFDDVDLPLYRGSTIIVKTINLFLFLTAYTIFWYQFCNHAADLANRLEGSTPVGGGQGASSASDTALNAAKVQAVTFLRRIKDTRNMAITQTISSTIIFTVFSIPQLWGFATYPMGFVLLLIATNEHVAVWYYRDAKELYNKKRSAEQSIAPSNNNNNNNRNKVGHDDEYVAAPNSNLEIVPVTRQSLSTIVEERTKFMGTFAPPSSYVESVAYHHHLGGGGGDSTSISHSATTQMQNKI